MDRRQRNQEASFILNACRAAYPSSGFSFAIKLDEDAHAFFAEVSGLTVDLHPHKQDEGEKSPYVHRLPTEKHANVVLKRGTVAKDSPLWTWANATLEGGLGQPLGTRSVSIQLLESERKTLAQWTLHGRIP